MNPTAFIIAIEDYSWGNNLPNLDGINRDADDFYKWLVEVKRLSPAAVFACADKDACPWATSGTTSAEIRRELYNFVTQAKERTSEAYFYFSGHGFAFSTSPYDTPVNLLVASDFSNPDIDGAACLDIDETIMTLKKSLGPAEQYFFIDACRNINDKVKPVGLGFSSNLYSLLGVKTVYKLFSTVQGEVGGRASGFTSVLIDGLKGKGTAKSWYRGRLWVTFGDLFDYVNERVERIANQQADKGIEGEGRGLILNIRPIPRHDCQITIANATAQDSFTIKVKRNVKDKEMRLLERMVENLRRYFPGIPDTEAIAKIIGDDKAQPRGAPLLLDGVLALDEVQKRELLPLPHNQVDYRGSWTSWRGVVNDQ